MDYFLSTENSFTLVTDSIETTNNSVEKSEYSTESTVTLINSSDIVYNSIYERLPFWIDSLMHLSHWCLAVFLNAFVVRHYSKEKGSTNRSYVLALAIIDLSFTSLKKISYSLRQVKYFIIT